MTFQRVNIQVDSEHIVIKSIYVPTIPIKISLLMQKRRSTIGMMIEKSENEFKKSVSFEEHCRLKY